MKDNKQKKKMLLVGILVHNDIGFLKRCIDSVISQKDASFDIMIIDNNSSDGSADFISRNYPRIKLVENKENEGTSVAWNRFLKESIKKRYFATLILNADIILEKNFIKNTILSLNKEGVGVAFPFQYDYDGHKYDKKFIGALKEQGKFSRSFLKLNEDAEVDWLPASSIAVKNDCARKIGFFDPIFFAYFEEKEFCRRAILNGFKILVSKKSILFHKGGLDNKHKERRMMFEISKYTYILTDRSNSLFGNSISVFSDICYKILMGAVRFNFGDLKFYFSLLKNLAKKVKILACRREARETETF